MIFTKIKFYVILNNSGVSEKSDLLASAVCRSFFRSIGNCKIVQKASNVREICGKMLTRLWKSFIMKVPKTYPNPLNAEKGPLS